MAFQDCGEMTVKAGDRIDAPVEIFEGIALIGRMDRILVKAEAEQYRFKAQYFFKCADDRDAAA